MGQPITWQNVNQGDASTAWRAMDSAQRSINGAFDGLQSLVKSSEDIQAKNDIAVRNNNTQDYLNKLAILGKTPADLAAAMKDGRVDALKASYGNAINHDQVRGAADALLNTRYAQDKAAIEWQHMSKDEQDAAVRDQIASMTAAGDTVGAAKLLADHQDMRNKAALVQAMDTRDQVGVERKRATTNFEDNLKTTQNQREVNTKNADSQRMSAGASVRQAAAAESSAATARLGFYAGQMDKAEERQLKAGAGLGSLNSHLAGSPEGGAEITKAIQNIQDSDARAAAARIVGQLPRDAQAADVTNLINTIIKPGFWGTLGMKNTSDAEVLKAFEPIYAASKADKTQSGIVEARKGIYANAAARALVDANAARDQLAAALPGFRGAAKVPAPAVAAVPAPAAAPVTTAMVPNAPAPAPVAVAPAAQAAAELRSFVKAPGASPFSSGMEPAFSLQPNGKPDLYPVLTRAMKTQIDAEVAKAKAAEEAGKAAKAAEAKANIQKILKDGLQRPIDVGYGD